MECTGKDASRLPEAGWFSFAPKVGKPELWTMDKINTAVSRLAVVRNGNRTLHAVQGGLRYEDARQTAAIVTLDAPLVAVGRPRLLTFDNTEPNLDEGFSFNLHNNIWGTNFTMWFEDDMKYRFTLTLVSA